MRRLAALGLALAGCHGGGGGGDAGVDSLRPPDAATSRTLRVLLAVNVLADPALGAGDQPTDYFVTVRDELGQPVDDATVRAGPMGDASPLAGAGGGTYEGAGTGWAARFEVTVQRGDDFLNGALAPSPSLYDVTLEPDPPRRNTAGELRWTPSMEPGVMAQVVVTLPGAGTTHPGVNGRDDGVEPLDAATWPALGDYLVAITRSTSETFDSPESMGLVQVVVRRTVTVSE